MGEAKLLNASCTTVALRYRFVFKRLENGGKELQYRPHELIKLEVEDTANSEEETNAATAPPQAKEEEVIYEDDVEYLRSLDPKEWKKQDHYKVLGIKNLRYEASDAVIKTAYRKMVLRHHPDKRKALGEEVRADDDYFTCITMAYETLGNPTKRRSYDSVDPYFDDNIPSLNEVKKDFYKICSYYFDLNSRWSESKNVPALGGPDATREHVERFYDFWYNFKSWREYSYEDEEDKEKCTDRDERRYVEKLNKAERLRKKKEENARIRQLVDLAYDLDPRIAKFKQEDKDRKLAAKRAKQTAAQQRKEEEERLAKEALLAKEKAEAEERARIEAKRQEREAQKKAIKKEKRLLRDACKSNNYFSTNPDENLAHMTALDKICETLNLLQLEELNKEIKSSGKEAFLKAVKETMAKTEAEKQAENMVLSQQQKSIDKAKQQAMKINPEWSDTNLQLLIKAVNLFPAGTNQRWEVVANFLNQHGTFKDNSGRFNAKMVLAKAKDLQNTDFSKNNLKEVANKNAFDNFQKEKKSIEINESGISRKVTSSSTTSSSDKSSKNDKNSEMMKNGINGKQDEKEKDKDKKQEVITNGNLNSNAEKKKEKVVADNPWTAMEQQLLEQALKTYPSNTPERWDRIAECIPTRNKKECMKRYKELVETIKAKKAAQQQAAK